MSTSEKTPSWWAVSTTRARLTALGASTIVLALLATSAFVWMSPANPVSRISAAIGGSSAAAEESDAAARAMVLERNELLGQVVELREQLADSKVSMTSTKAELAAIQQQLWSTEGKLEAAVKSGGGTKPPTTQKPKPKPTKTTASVAGITAPPKAELVNPASPYFGMYTEQAPFNWAEFDNTSTKIGSAPSVVGYFGGWDEDYRANAVTRAWQRGTMPILTWEGRPIAAANDVIEEPEYSLPRILGDPEAGVPGAFDEYLRTYARDIVATGLPLGIRLNHEMNGTWYPWSEDNGYGKPINGNRPGDYAKTWQYVHDIFEEEGANDLVVWIWAPNIINRLPESHRASSYLDGLYPGDEYVDWVGLSAYLRPPFRSGVTYDFDYTFEASLAELRRITDKPILLAEIGATEIGSHKVDWVTSLFDNLAAPENSDIVGFNWFNLAVTSYVQGERATNDWRIDSRADSLEAFRAGLALPTGRFRLTPK